jgi:hypothetical protein
MRDREPTIRSRELGEGLRLLSGKRGGSALDVAAFLGACRVKGPERDRLLALCQSPVHLLRSRVRASHPGGWPGGDVRPVAPLVADVDELVRHVAGGTGVARCARRHGRVVHFHGIRRVPTGDLPGPQRCSAAPRSRTSATPTPTGPPVASGPPRYHWSRVGHGAAGARLRRVPRRARPTSCSPSWPSCSSSPWLLLPTKSTNN